MAEQLDQAAMAPTDDEAPQTDASPTTDPNEELARLRERLSTVNRESAERRRELDRLRAEQAERERAEMSEAERLQAELAELRADRDRQAAELRRARLLEAGRAAAQAEQLRFAPTAMADAIALGLLGDDIDPGDADAVRRAVKAVAKARPAWLEQPAEPVDISARQRGGARQPSDDELIQQKRASGPYRPL